MRLAALLAAALTAGAAAAAAQAPGAQTPLAPAPAAQTPTPVLGVDSQVRSQYQSVRSLLTKAADLMPDEGYAFQPTPDMRTFAGAVAHTASANFGMCANLVGKPNPQAGVDLEKTLTTKTAAVKALNDSFTFCDEYVTHLTPEMFLTTYRGTSVTRGGQRSPIDIVRGGLLGNLVAHGNEMYGYMAVYLRLKGLVPPSSDRGTRGRGGDAPRFD